MCRSSRHWGMHVKHALIIEDQPVIALAIQDELRDCGYESADIAITEAEAIRRAEEKCPDLITVDERLDDGSGIAAIRHICRDKAIPVIFITASPDQIKAAVPDAVILEKPFSHRNLSSAILKAVKGARLFG